MTKITKREMFTTLLNLASDGFFDEVESPLVTTIADFCAHEIALLDKRGEAAKRAAAKRRSEPDELIEAVYEALSDVEYEPIAVIALRVDMEGVTIGKITNRLSALVREGRAEKVEMSIKEDDAPARRVMCYRAI